jgi:hypothetical protein
MIPLIVVPLWSNSFSGWRTINLACPLMPKAISKLASAPQDDLLINRKDPRNKTQNDDEAVKNKHYSSVQTQVHGAYAFGAKGTQAS